MSDETIMRMRNMLRDVMMETLEEYAFMFAEAGEYATEPADSPVEYLSSSVVFRGADQCGEVLVALPVSMCAEMAANVMGMDPEEVPETAVEDAIREWANIVTGSLTAKWFGVNTVFALDPPSSLRGSLAEVSALKGGAEPVVLSVDEQLVVGCLRTASEGDAR